MFKKIFRYAGFAILGFIAFVLLYLLAAYCLSGITTGKEPGAPEEVAIYIKTNGVHTDLVVPVKGGQLDWSREIQLSDTHLQDTANMEYLALGWGDKGFYLQTPQWSDLKASVAFKAAFGLSTTAIHTCFYKHLQESKSCNKIMISNLQYTRLIAYISGSFRKDSAGHVIKILTDVHYNDADAFYEARGRYSLFYTCNTWANNGLKSCGQKACFWTPFDTGIFHIYK